jgi:hypothetical protein
VEFNLTLARAARRWYRQVNSTTPTTAPGRSIDTRRLSAHFFFPDGLKGAFLQSNDTVNGRLERVVSIIRFASE